MRVSNIELTITVPGLLHKRTGDRPAARRTAKFTKYWTSYQGITEENLIVISVESSGFTDGTSVTGLKRLANAVLERRNVTPSTVLADLRLSISAALQRSQMETINNYISVLCLDPRLMCRRCLSTKAACAAARARPGGRVCPGEVVGQRTTRDEAVAEKEYDSDEIEATEADAIAALTALG